MSIVDLKLDISQLDGASVQVTGAMMMFGGMAMLTDPRQPFDANPIPVDVDGLSRDDREFLIARCNTSCRVSVQGEVGTVFFQPGIVARSLMR